MYIRCNDGEAQITIATGKYSTKFKAEGEALKRALRIETTYTEHSAMWSSSQMLSLSSNSPQNPRQKDPKELETAMVELGSQKRRHHDCRKSTATLPTT